LLLYDIKQPLTVWFQYPREREFIVYKLLGYSVEAVVKKQYDKEYNIAYLNYLEVNNKIYMKWTRNVNEATKFHFDKIKWNEISWINFGDKDKPQTALVAVEIAMLEVKKDQVVVSLAIFTKERSYAYNFVVPLFSTPYTHNTPLEDGRPSVPVHLGDEVDRAVGIIASEA
jgi:hypothetical protein